MRQTDEFLEVLRRNGHVRDPQARLVPMHGGVSSEIYLVEDGDAEVRSKVGAGQVEGEGRLVCRCGAQPQRARLYGVRGPYDAGRGSATLVL